MDRNTQYSGLLDKPLSSLTVGEFFEVMESQITEIKEAAEKATQVVEKKSVTEKYMYGIEGLAKLFGCSKTTANRIKQSGRIDKAVQQLGRQIVINADYAIELAGKSTKSRRNINSNQDIENK